MLKLLWTAPLSAKIGILTILAYTFVAVFAPLLAPYAETAIVGSSYELWSDEFVFGTDNIGRDMLTRLIYGARNTIGIAFLTVALAFLVGGALGMLAAILGGTYDMLISRLVDILMAIPSLVFALLLLTVFGTSIPSLIIIIALLDSTRVFRIARSAAMNVVVMEFVEAARLRGEGMAWVIRKEVLPNIIFYLLQRSASSDWAFSPRWRIGVQWFAKTQRSSITTTLRRYCPRQPSQALPWRSILSWTGCCIFPVV